MNAYILDMFCLVLNWVATVFSLCNTRDNDRDLLFKADFDLLLRSIPVAGLESGNSGTKDQRPTHSHIVRFSSMKFLVKQTSSYLVFKNKIGKLNWSLSFSLTSSKLKYLDLVTSMLKSHLGNLIFSIPLSDRFDSTRHIDSSAPK